MLQAAIVSVVLNHTATTPFGEQSTLSWEMIRIAGLVPAFA